MMSLKCLKDGKDCLGKVRIGFLKLFKVLIEFLRLVLEVIEENYESVIIFLNKLIWRGIFFVCCL